MATKNDINRLFAEVMEYAKTTATQSAITAINSNAQQTNLLVNVEKAINSALTTAYNNSSRAMQKKLDELESSVTQKVTSELSAKTPAAQKKTSGRRSSKSKAT